jgi:hypothetical protein
MQYHDVKIHKYIFEDNYVIVEYAMNSKHSILKQNQIQIKKISNIKNSNKGKKNL